jgi:hypothetical protein
LTIVLTQYLNETLRRDAKLGVSTMDNAERPYKPAIIQ